jgi:ATP-dependent DNA helicase HFM1/MER3
MKQIDSIGVVAVRKLVAAGINNLEALEAAEAYRIDTILSKNPPFGTRLLEKFRGFPKLMVTAKMTGKVGHEIRCDDNNAVLTILQETRPGKPVKVNFKAEIGFMNDKAPTFFLRRPVYVCFLAETSDGYLIDFRRMR